jgi:hypothetical protein
VKVEMRGSAGSARLLIDRGADIEARDTSWESDHQRAR